MVSVRPKKNHRYSFCHGKSLLKLYLWHFLVGPPACGGTEDERSDLWLGDLEKLPNATLIRQAAVTHLLPLLEAMAGGQRSLRQRCNLDVNDNLDDGAFEQRATPPAAACGTLRLVQPPPALSSSPPISCKTRSFKAFPLIHPAISSPAAELQQQYLALCLQSPAVSAKLHSCFYSGAERNPRGFLRNLEKRFSWKYRGVFLRPYLDVTFQCLTLPSSVSPARPAKRFCLPMTHFFSVMSTLTELRFLSSCQND